MILLRMRGGRLGNQMFQYAFARYLQVKNPGQELKINFDDVKNQAGKGSGFDNSLKYFNVPSSEDYFSVSTEMSAFQKLLMRIYGKFYPCLPYRMMLGKQKYQKKWIGLLSFAGIYHYDYGYHKFPLKKKWYQKNLLVFGTFESDKYFSEIRDVLLAEFTPKYPPRECNKQLYEHIKNENSVAISIRRGDFVVKNEIGEVHNVCTMDYFNHAIRLAKELVEKPTFIFFSDDIEWVKRHFQVDAPCYYESGHDPIWEKMRLMYSCKHFIISNSTYSWWGQYLGRNPQKIVIAPDRWFNSDFIPDIYQSNWHLIKV